MMSQLARIGGLATCILTSFAWPCHAAQPDLVRQQKPPDWFALSPEAFRTNAAVQKRIPFPGADLDLLSAAIHHETNRRRVAHRLPPLEPHPQARAAAALQSEVMAAEGFVGHVDPVHPERRELQDRIKHVGLTPSYAGENVALAFGRQYESGRGFITEREGGQTVYRYTPGGPPIEMHTYDSFAVALLNYWMESPGHRENILRRRPRFLGCGAAPARNEVGMEVFYCAQVFFTPLEATR
jgi:uncharacterized protein YkwD